MMTILLIELYLIKTLILTQTIECEFEKLMHPLIQLSKEKKIVLYLHLSSNQSLLEEYLIYKNFKKIDDVIGLHYPNYSDMCISDIHDSALKQSDKTLQILVVDNGDSLKKWVEIYCLSFNIGKNKEKLIYRILKKKFNIFKFVFASINSIGDNKRQYVGCSVLFSYNYCINLYCLGTLKEYRHKSVATSVIDFSIGYGRKKGNQIFGLQTLKSDNLLSFYQKKGFVTSYIDKIYRICNS